MKSISHKSWLLRNCWIWPFVLSKWTILWNIEVKLCFGFENFVSFHLLIDLFYHFSIRRTSRLQQTGHYPRHHWKRSQLSGYPYFANYWRRRRRKGWRLRWQAQIKQCKKSFYDYYCNPCQTSELERTEISGICRRLWWRTSGQVSCLFTKESAVCLPFMYFSRHRHVQLASIKLHPTNELGPDTYLMQGNHATSWLIMAHDFSITQILCEINSTKSGSCKLPFWHFQRL